jgi:hypothetical protein
MISLDTMRTNYYDNDVRMMVITTKMSNNDDDYNTANTSSSSCYWLCNRKAELKVYTDFGNILHLCKIEVE